MSENGFRSRFLRGRACLTISSFSSSSFPSSSSAPFPFCSSSYIFLFSFSSSSRRGQAQSPGFLITNAFGQVLDEKIVAENHLRASGVAYTIIRPGGLKAKPPTGKLVVRGEDTTKEGEISRDLVADVAVLALKDGGARNKVLDIVESGEEGPEKVVSLK